MDTDDPRLQNVAKSDVLESFRTLPEADIEQYYAELVPPELTLPEAFWSALDANQRAIALRLCLLAFVSSDFTVLPRAFQLQAAIAIITGNDCLVDVGTGSGKTLVMVLLALYYSKRTLLVVSPLKRLQVLQVAVFERYGLPTVAINEDTPADAELWKKIVSGHFSVIIAQPEQLSGLHQGHHTKFSRILTEETDFTKNIVAICIDEAHFIYTAGTDLYGLPAFRPAFGRLGGVRITIGRRTPVLAMSGTQPPHIKKHIISSLLMNVERLLHIKLSSNRPNLVYATHQIVGSRSDLRNLAFLVPVDHDGPLERAIVFHDDSKEAAAAAMYLNSRLAPSKRHLGIIRHYHGGMLKLYLQAVFDDFSNPDGMCRILHATSGASTGLDVADIRVVVQYGVPRDVPNALQRGGRAGRSSSNCALFLLMYESWALDVDLSQVAGDIASDPDHPIVNNLTRNTNKQDRTGWAILFVVQMLVCLRCLFADYLGDRSSDALETATQACCDGPHGDDAPPSKQIQASQFFGSPMLYLDPMTGVAWYGQEGDPNRKLLNPTAEKRKPSDDGEKKENRKVPDRAALSSRLIVWRTLTSKGFGPLFPPEFLLNDKGVVALSAHPPGTLSKKEDITDILGETKQWNDTWAQAVFELVKKYDEELVELRPAPPSKKTTRNTKRTKDVIHGAQISKTGASPSQQVECSLATSGRHSQVGLVCGCGQGASGIKIPGPGSRQRDRPPQEREADIATDPFSSYFNCDDPSLPPKVLITTSFKASKATYEFCDELVGVFPGAEFRRRKKGKGFEMGRIAAWAADRGYKHLMVVNEDMKKPNALTVVYLPNGPTAYFKLTSIELTKQIFGHARATPHYPELILNGFVTRLGHCVGRMFQTTMPPLPEFAGRQVVTLHNQRDFIFFRRHRYAFRSEEKVALQEIGPRFTLKLRWLKKNIPAVYNYGESAAPLTIEKDEEDDAFEESENKEESEGSKQPKERPRTVPPKVDEYIWQWKPQLETSRKTFFL
ncbi:hypothetical protein NMY22_g6193 [Coprinellus aureogranulatus]|nr:hypothetical protein NMY22_g6193 [Coprinellus aureogranulatus]